MVSGNIIRIILSVVSGILLALSFPKYDLYLIAWVAIVPLLYCITDVTLKQSCIYGFICGFIFSNFAFSWFFSDFLLEYSRVPLYTNFLTYLALSIYFAAYFGVFTAIINILSRTMKLAAYLLSPFIFVLLEYIRANAFTGLPWELLGHSQYRFLQIIQIADITGVYGVSFLLVLSNAAIVLLLKEHTRSTALVKTTVIASCALIVLAVVYGSVKMGAGSRDAKLFRVSLIQGNTTMEEKLSNDAKIAQGIIDAYGRMTTQALSQNPDIVVWPETSMPFIFGMHKETTESLLNFQKRTGVPLLMGIIRSTGTSSQQKRYLNSALLIANGELQAAYNKVKLVPFAEYVPGRVKIGKLIDNYNYESGNAYTVFELGNMKFSSLICYEIIFPEISRNLVAQGAMALFAISNDAWFGDTSAPYQHFSMAVFRAVENRVPLVRVANTGVSGFIDRCGRITETGSIFRKEILTGDISPGNGDSFYTRYGDFFITLCGIASMMLIVLLKYYNRSVH